MNAKGHRNATIAVACYFIGRAGTSIPLPVAKRTAHSEGWSAPDDVWLEALDIVNDRDAFTQPEEG